MFEVTAVERKATEAANSSTAFVFEATGRPKTGAAKAKFRKIRSLSLEALWKVVKDLSLDDQKKELETKSDSDLHTIMRRSVQAHKRRLFWGSSRIPVLFWSSCASSFESIEATCVCSPLASRQFRQVLASIFKTREAAALRRSNKDLKAFCRSSSRLMEARLKEASTSFSLTFSL